MAGKNGKTPLTTADIDKFTSIVKTPEYRTHVAELVRNSIGKGVKVTATDDILADYRENEVIKGLTGKAEVDAIVALETEAMAVRNLAAIVNMRGSELGQILADAKSRVGHGNWSYFCQMRMGMNMRNVQRALSAARTVTVYPKLLEVVDNIPQTVLSEIGSSKEDLSDEQVDNLFSLADKDALDISKAREIYQGAKATKAVPPLPFDKIPQDTAALASEAIIERMQQTTSDISVKALDASLKHPSFTKWLQEMSRKPVSELQKESRNLMIFAWMIEESLYSPTTTLVDYPADGSPIVTDVEDEEELFENEPA